MTPQTRPRLIPRDRRASILDAAVTLAAHTGYNRVTREAIATAAGCSPALVSHTFGTIQALRRAIMGEAIRLARAHGEPAALAIIAQGLAVGDNRATHLPGDIRQRAAASLAG